MLKIIKFLSAALALASFSAYLSNDMLLPALPALQRHFEISPNQAQWSIASWLFGAVSLQLVIGIVLNRYGYRKVLLVGKLLLVISTVACIFMSQYQTFLFMRFAQGVAVCAISVSIMAFINSYYAGNEIVRKLTIVNSVAVVAPALGPIIGSYTMLYGWNASFWLNAVLSICSLIFCYASLPKEQSISEPIVVKKLLHEYIKIVTNSEFLLRGVSLSLLNAGLIAWVVGSPYIFIQIFDYVPQQYGVMQLFVFSAFILGNFVSKRKDISANHESNFIKVIYYITIISATLLYIASHLSWKHIEIYLLIFISIYGFGFGMGISQMTFLTFSCVPQSKSYASAIFYTFMLGFASLASFFVEVYYSGTVASVTKIILFCTVASIVLMSLISYFRNRRRERDYELVT